MFFLSIELQFSMEFPLIPMNCSYKSLKREAYDSECVFDTVTLKSGKINVLKVNCFSFRIIETFLVISRTITFNSNEEIVSPRGFYGIEDENELDQVCTGQVDGNQLVSSSSTAHRNVLTASTT